VTNPFDDEDGEFFVLVNDEGQYSLWPGFADIPPGWEIVHGKASHADCVAFVDANWVDMRPKSLVAFMDDGIGHKAP
jgi:MbtH protein